MMSLSPCAGRKGLLLRGYAQLGVDPQLWWGISAPVLRSMVFRDAGRHVGGHGKMPSDGHVVARWRS